VQRSISERAGGSSLEYPISGKSSSTVISRSLTFHIENARVQNILRIELHLQAPHEHAVGLAYAPGVRSFAWRLRRALHDQMPLAVERPRTQLCDHVIHACSLAAQRNPNRLKRTHEQRAVQLALGREQLCAADGLGYL